MVKTFQRSIMITTLRAIISFLLLKTNKATTAFSNIDLSQTTLDPASTGFFVIGETSSGKLGTSASKIGDIDNDGYDDIIIGAPTIDSSHGAAYVIYGGPKSSMTNFHLSSQDLDPHTTGFMITGNAANDGLGIGCTGGDINNDGYDDIMIGASGKDSYRGALYAIYGGPRSSMMNIDLSSQTLDPHTSGFMITGNAANDNLGLDSNAAGDINNDGYNDIIVGAPGNNGNAGIAYVIYGGEKSSRTNIDLSSQTLNPLTTGFMITGSAADDLLGYSVSTAGDVNNDGFDDILLAAHGRNSNTGAIYVLYGGEKSSRTNIYLNSQTLDPLTTGFMVTGNAAGDYLGWPANTAGDINKDGYDDIIIGAPFKNGNKGAAYVIYGGEKSSMANRDLSTQTLDPLTTGFMITGNIAGDILGFPVNTAGDINNDGYSDILVGAQGRNTNTGVAYVIYGGEKSSMGHITLGSVTLDPLTTGFMITGNAAGDYFARIVGTAGDVNNDGIGDIIITADNKNGGSGAAYVIYGAPCLLNCHKCGSPSECTECKSPYSLYQSDCFDPCPDTYFAKNRTCETCPNNCNQCSSSSLCSECLSPYLLYQSKCLDSCPLATFTSIDVCIDCPSHCFYCKSQTSCIICDQGYTLSNSLCVSLSYVQAREKATRIISSATKGLGSVICVGSAVFPLSALVSKIVQNTRYMNLSVTTDLSEIYKTWDTNIISWDIPNIMEDLDHFETSPPLFARYDVGSPFLVNFWPTLVNIAIGFSIFVICIVLQKLLEDAKYEGWAYSLVQKLVAGSFNFALVQAYACLDDILMYLVLDAKTNPFNSFFSWMSLICAVIFLAVGCLLVFFNFWTVQKFQNVKKQGMKEIEAFNERNKYWELFYSDFSDDDLWSQSFFALLIIRSSLSSFAIAVLYDYPLMQTVYLVILDGVILLFLYFKMPFNTLRAKLMQYYYEIITLLVHICTFILAFQDTFEKPSENVKTIMSTGIIYLNTTLITGAIGFMFIEIYKTISQKTRAAKLKRYENIAIQTAIYDTLETSKDHQSFKTETRRKILENFTSHQQQTEVHENLHFLQGNTSMTGLNMETFQVLESDNSVLSDVFPINGVHQQRNQNPVPIIIRHRPQARNQRQQQRNNPRNPSYTINYE